MKVLFIIPNLQGGGAEKLIINLSKRMNTENFQSSVFVMKKTGEYLDSELCSNIIYSSISHKKTGLASFLITFFQLLFLSRKYNVIIGGLELTSTYIAVLIGLILRKPSIGWIHTNMAQFSPRRKFFHKILIKIFYPFTVKIICVSQSALESFLTLYPNWKYKCEVIYNPIINSKSIAVIKKNISTHPKIILIGRLIPEKCFDRAISSLPILIKNNIYPTLYILGTGPEKDNLLELAESLGMSDKVFLVGFKTNPSPFINNSDVLVVVSEYEGFGMVILEALSSGIPIITWEGVGGPIEILENGKYGLIIKNNSPDSIAAGIQNLISRPKLVKDFSILGPMRAKDFSYENFFNRFISLLSQIIQ